MGLLDFLALRADRQIRGLEVFVGASLIPTGFGMSVFWIRHVRVMLLKQTIFEETLRFAQGDVSPARNRHFFSKSFNAENAPKSPGAFC